MEHIPYPHTVSFPVLKKDKLAEREYQLSQGLPTPFPLRAKYRGTIKLHGTNATLIFRNNNRTAPTFQSRNRIITLLSDNHGTVAHLSGAGIVATLTNEIMRIHGSRSFTELMVAGELCGEGVQRGVAIACMERFFCIFAIRIDGVWVDMAKYASVAVPERRVYNIMNYRTWEVEIDLAGGTKAVYKQMTTYTREVGKRCPFAEQFVDAEGAAIVGLGEGIVWTLIPEERHDVSVKKELVNFKTKTERFSTRGKKPAVPLEAGVSERATRFVEYAVGERRLEQGVEYMREMGKTVEKKSVGEFVKWVAQDAVREEKAAMEEMGADEKIVRTLVAGKAKQYWFKVCEE